MSINQAEVKKQVEYYLSDQNLETDKFFRDVIQSTEEGYLRLDYILKCNKIKKLNVTTSAQLASAVEDSTVIELNIAKDSVRRIGNKPLLNKDLSTDETENVKRVARNAEKQELANFYEAFQPIIFSTSCIADGVANWRNVTEALLKQHNVHAPYCRFGKQEGNFALNKDKTEQVVIDRIVTDGLNFGEHSVSVHIATEDELKKFWELHGRHYNGIMDLKKKEINKDLKAGNKGKKEKRGKKTISFGGEDYTEIGNVKNLFKGILGRTANGQKIISPYHDMLKELLAFHEKGEEKLNTLTHFTVDVHPEYKDTRCFFAVKPDGSREDFSAVKCLANLEAKMVA